MGGAEFLEEIQYHHSKASGTLYILLHVHCTYMHNLAYRQYRCSTRLHRSVRSKSSTLQYMYMYLEW